MNDKKISNSQLLMFLITLNYEKTFNWSDKRR